MSNLGFLTRATLDIPQARRATEMEMLATRQQTSRMGTWLNLSEYVNSQLQYPVRAVSREYGEAFSELNASIRQRTGEAASGTWLPLSMLCSRDISTTSGGALLTPAKHGPAPDTLGLSELSGVLRAGATVLTGLSGSSVGLPRLAAALDVGDAWSLEGAAPTSAEPSILHTVLAPKSLVIEMVISRRLLQNASADVDALLRSELRARIGAAIDRVALAGDGVAQPLGLLSAEGLKVHALGPNGAALSHADMCALEHLVNTPHPPAGGLTWMASPKLVHKLRTTPRNDAVSVLEDRDALGYPLQVQQHMPDNLTKGTSTGVCSALVLGNFAELFVGFWGAAAVDLIVDGHTMAKDGRVRIVARCEIGIAARHIEHFAAVRDALTA